MMGPNLSGGGKSKTLDFDINIVPIVDALTILITFMLAAGVYYSIAMLDVKVSGGASDSVPVQRHAVNITVDVDDTLALTLRVSGQESIHDRYESSGGKVDGRKLNQELDRLKARYPSVVTATVVANKNVHYQHVVSAMEYVRRTHPDVLLGGF